MLLLPLLVLPWPLVVVALLLLLLLPPPVLLLSTAGRGLMVLVVSSVSRQARFIFADPPPSWLVVAWRRSRRTCLWSRCGGDGGE